MSSNYKTELCSFEFSSMHQREICFCLPSGDEEITPSTVVLEPASVSPPRMTSQKYNETLATDINQYNFKPYRLWEKYNDGINYEEAIVEIELLKDAIVVGHYIINDNTALDYIYTVAEFSSLVNCVHDTAMSASLNQLVPSERNKLKSQCTLKAATLHLIKHNMFATEDPSQQPMPFKDMQPYSIYGWREQSLPQQGEQYPYSNSLILKQMISITPKSTAKLANLVYHLSRKTIQASKDGYHDPVEDAFATLQIFLPHEDLFKGSPKYV